MFKKTRARGNPFILANPKPGFRPHLNPGFRFIFFRHIKYILITQGAPWSWNLGRPFSRPGKLWKTAKVIWKVVENDDNVMEFLEGGTRSKNQLGHNETIKQCCANRLVPVRLAFFLSVSKQITPFL